MHSPSRLTHSRTPILGGSPDKVNRRFAERLRRYVKTELFHWVKRSCRSTMNQAINAAEPPG